MLVSLLALLDSCEFPTSTRRQWWRWRHLGPASEGRMCVGKLEGPMYKTMKRRKTVSSKVQTSLVGEKIKMSSPNMPPQISHSLLQSSAAHRQILVLESLTEETKTNCRDATLKNYLIPFVHARGTDIVQIQQRWCADRPCLQAGPDGLYSPISHSIDLPNAARWKRFVRNMMYNFCRRSCCREEICVMWFREFECWILVDGGRDREKMSEMALRLA